LIIGLLHGALAIGALDAVAEPLVPSQPSQVVTARGNTESSPQCPNRADWSMVDFLLKLEGGSTPFTIPGGFVLVVTSYEFNVGPDPAFAGLYGGVELAAVAPAGSFGAHSTTFVILDRSGAGFGTGFVPSGLIVKPPANLCFAGSNAFVTIH